MAAKMIVNADDFGVSAEVNAAVVQARRKGVLTSASLMVTGACYADAVDIARRDPGLAVGLHLTLSNGASLLPPAEIPLIADSKGRFIDSPARAGLRYYFNGRAGNQLRKEIEAQFEAFARTGLQLSHVDGHQHLHLHPTVFPLVLEFAKRYGARGMRIPCEPFWRGVGIDSSKPAAKAAVAMGHAYLRSGVRRRLSETGLATCERSIGSLMSGRMSAGYVIAMLRRLRCRSIEVFFHPSVADSGGPLGPNRGDLDALLDPALRSFIEASDYELTSYFGMRERVSACGLD